MLMILKSFLNSCVDKEFALTSMISLILRDIITRAPDKKLEHRPKSWMWNGSRTKTERDTQRLLRQGGRRIWQTVYSSVDRADMEYFAHFVCSASFHYVITTSVVASVGCLTCGSHRNRSPAGKASVILFLNRASAHLLKSCTVLDWWADEAKGPGMEAISYVNYTEVAEELTWGRLWY